MAEALAANEQSRAARPRRASYIGPSPARCSAIPRARVTLVEFTDYACTYCRASVADVEALIAANPDLTRGDARVADLSRAATDAARMALAAAQQGKYRRSHDAMFAVGPPTAATIGGAARTAGLDMAARRAFGASAAAATFELAQEHASSRAGSASRARRAGWPARRILNGAVGRAPSVTQAAGGRKEDDVIRAGWLQCWR